MNSEKLKIVMLAETSQIGFLTLSPWTEVSLLGTETSPNVK